MSLSGALSNALSGLNANARSTSVVSSNIANALNESYGRREIDLGTDVKQTSGGVSVIGVSRHSDPVLAQQKRFASAELGKNDVLARFAASIEEVWGSVDTLSSVASKLTEFETALLSAASDPSSEVRLRSIAIAADDLSAAIRTAGDAIQEERTRADADIDRMVDELNSGLLRIESLNTRIVTAKHLGQDVLGLLDQRDAQLEAISALVPLHLIERETGAVSLFTRSGKSLLDTTAVQIGFQTHGIVEAHMRMDNGLLSGLTMNGEPVASGDPGPFSGGRLAALFAVRDNFAVSAQSRLDGLARDLIERFEAGGPDQTVLSGNAGVFTDGGAAFVATDEIGVSQRLQLAASLAPASDELWRWRDGLYAAGPGEVGESGLLAAIHARLSNRIGPGSTALSANPASFIEHVQGFTSDVSGDRVLWEDALSFSEAQFADIRERAASQGVDSDQELQALIELEKAYAANARVVRVVDDMLSELLRI